MQAGGSYTHDECGGTTITIGLTTLAACPDGLQSEAFLQYFGAATNFTFDGEKSGLYWSPAAAQLTSYSTLQAEG